MNDAGAYGLTGKPWTPSTVSLFLRTAAQRRAARPQRRDGIGKGTWPALVDESTWRAAQSVLERTRARTRPQDGAPAPADRCAAVRQAGLRRLHVRAVDATGQRIAYALQACRGVSIRAEHVEPLLYRLVSGRLAMPDAVDLLKAELHDEAEAEAIAPRAETLYAELDHIGVERAERLLTGRRPRSPPTCINEKIAKLRTAPTGSGTAAGVRRHTAGQARGRRRGRAALAGPVPRCARRAGDGRRDAGRQGGRVFNPERVQVNWR